MKRIMIMIIAVMIVSGAAVAREVSANATVVKSGSTFKVSYIRSVEASVKISIYNEATQLVYAERINNISSFTRPYNFSDLPEGRYSIEITDGESVVVKSVLHKKDVSEKHVKWSPLKGSDYKYVLTVANQGTDYITVNMYDQKGNLQYTQREKIVGDFAKVYDLRKFKGKILVEVADANGNIKAVNN